VDGLGEEESAMVVMDVGEGSVRRLVRSKVCVNGVVVADVEEEDGGPTSIDSANALLSPTQGQSNVKGG
jgi:hypothetical protein